VNFNYFNVFILMALILAVFAVLKKSWPLAVGAMFALGLAVVSLKAGH